MKDFQLFRRFYQQFEISQSIDLSQCREEYELPNSHPDAEKIHEAVQNIIRGISSGLKRLGHPGLCIGTVKAADRWILRYRNLYKNSRAQIEGAPTGPYSADILRPVMNRHLRQTVTRKALDVLIPEEYLVCRQRAQSSSKEYVTYKDFLVVAEKMDVLSPSETLEALEQMPPSKQAEIADTICQLVYYTGYMDAHFENILLTKDGTVTVVDTEGHSLLHDSSERYTPISLADARIVGLQELIRRANSHRATSFIANTAYQYLSRAQTMRKVQLVSIFLSVICPLIPLIVLVCSVAYARLHNLCYRPQASMERQNYSMRFARSASCN